MQVAKRGNSLAVRLLAVVVEALGLKEGDDIEIHVADLKFFGVARTSSCDKPIERLRAFRGRLPADFKVDVLLYLTSSDATKADHAEELVRAGGTISVQVLNEVASVGRRTMRLSWSGLHLLLGTLQNLLRVVPVTIETHKSGVALAERHMLSTYDAMIVAAALLAGCDRLWSEDMQDGFIADDTLRIVDPFRSSKERASL